LYEDSLSFIQSHLVQLVSLSRSFRPVLAVVQQQQFVGLTNYHLAIVEHVNYQEQQLGVQVLLLPYQC
jgi:hypothetical protein